MIVILHVFIAVSSLMLATYTFIKPSRTLFLANYSFVAATVLSGAGLVWMEPSRMLHVCEVGLLYLAIVSLATVAARSRFIRVESKSSSL